jgi:hypothetical protein
MAALAATRGNQIRAAVLLGLNRNTGMAIFPEAMGVSTSIDPLRLARHAGLQFIGIFERAALFSLVAAGVWRGGALLEPLGLAVVDTRGRPVSRARGCLRALIAWSPLLMAMVAAAMLPRPLLRPIGLLGVLTTTPVAQLELRLFVIGLCLLAGLVMLIAALVRPDRSVQDRLAGTWLVPR